MKRFHQSQTLDYCPETGEYVIVTRGEFFAPISPFRTSKSTKVRAYFSHDEIRAKTVALSDARKRCQENGLHAMAALYGAFARDLIAKAVALYI